MHTRILLRDDSPKKLQPDPQALQHSVDIVDVAHQLMCCTCEFNLVFRFTPVEERERRQRAPAEPVVIILQIQRAIRGKSSKTEMGKTTECPGRLGCDHSSNTTSNYRRKSGMVMNRTNTKGISLWTLLKLLYQILHTEQLTLYFAFILKPAKVERLHQ